MCTRILLNYKNGNNSLTARTMDWHTKLNTNIWAFPKGIKRCSMNPSSNYKFPWTSRYSSLVICERFDQNDNGQISYLGSASSDGINDQGLVVNSLWLSESSYKLAVNKSSKKHISIGIWVQFMLDNYKDVKGAVEAWKTNNYDVVTMQMPGEATGKNVNMHISISDRKGNSAIFEFYSDNDNENTQLHITTNLDIKGAKDVEILKSDCSVMTNSPVFEQQIQLNYFWNWQWTNSNNSKMAAANKASQLKTLPGTSRAPDRFARASFYLKNIGIGMEPETNGKPGEITDDNERVAQAFSLIKTVSVPLNYYRVDKDNPNISNTLWTSIYDHNKIKLFFQTSYLPNTYWCDLSQLKLDNKNDLLCFLINDAKHKEDILNGGDISSQMEIRKSEDFIFLLSSD